MRQGVQPGGGGREGGGLRDRLRDLPQPLRPQETGLSYQLYHKSPSQGRRFLETLLIKAELCLKIIIIFPNIAYRQIQGSFIYLEDPLHRMIFEHNTPY